MSVGGLIPGAVELRICASKWVTSRMKKKYISLSASTLEVKFIQVRLKDLELSLDSIKLLVKTL